MDYPASMFRRSFFALSLMTLCAASLSCGKASSPTAPSRLDDLADYIAFDIPCTLSTAQPNLTQPLIVNYLCKGAYSPADRSWIYFELSPTHAAPEEVSAPWEAGELQRTAQTATYSEYSGYTTSRRHHVIVRIAQNSTTTVTAPPQIFLEPGTTLFGLRSEEPTSPESCNGPDVIHPQIVRLPFQVGRLISVAQGENGSFSHQNAFDEERNCMHHNYAFDFGATVGTPVYAARAGKVLSTKENSNHGCGNASCGSEANYVLIEHDDGSVAYYYHLQYQGAIARTGQTVRRGQLIARTGNTGFSTGPHLHFEIRTSDNRYTIAPYFQSAEFPSGNLVVEGGRYTVIEGEQ